MRTEKQQAAAAKKFAAKWQGRGYEKGDTQSFWIELLAEVYGVEDASSFIRFEEQVKAGSTKFIDASIDATKTLIEQKSLGKDLRKGILQSDGSLLTPFQQAKRYAAELSYSARPRWIVTCNFAEFLVYDMERPNSDPEQILLKDLEKEYYRLQFLVDTKSEHLSKEMQVSMKAGEIVGKLYDELLGQYLDPTNPDSLKSLNVLCVRLVFCLYAEDAGIFGRRDMFHDFLAGYPVEEMRNALIRLFKVMDTPVTERDPYLREDLLAFPYTNGGLFADEQIEIPRMNDRIRQLLLQNASLDFDWSEISPTIFGAVFESTLNSETRRSGGMHYTSIENIHKVIDPLFLNNLRAEFDAILEEKVVRQRTRRLEDFQDKLASLTFLDPACGSGNFLTETYLSLRRLENEVIRERYQGRAFIGFEEVNPIKVSIDQFYGIEINDFAVTVATTALWISEAQMLAETERIIHHDIDFLPLKKYSNIREGNALRMDWDVIDVPDDTPTIHAKEAYATIIKPDSDDVNIASEPVVTYEKINLQTSHLEIGPKKEERKVRIHYDYIIGNPPFVGARMMSESQKQDVIDVFGAKWKNVGNLDYVCCWYKKAAKLMKDAPQIRAALVSTNSICQGEQVANLWQNLFEDGLQINFAYRTFRWDSEASQKAHVHCVIVGFSMSTIKPCIIYDGDRQIHASHINAYLTEAPDIFIEKRMHPLCDVPEICLGGQPIDDGNLILSEEDKEHLVHIQPKAAQFIRQFMMGKDFIDRKPRYCLWLQGVAPSQWRNITEIYERVSRVREFRSSSKRSSTLRAAQSPMYFGAPFACNTDYIAMPKVSSENRRYIPIDYLSKEIIPGDKLFCMQDATLFHFGILNSNVHMAWMRAVCGRLKSDYSYSNTIVYNNFPWPEASEEQRARIERTAQAILDARALYPESSLADLYDEVTMPPELRKAHQDNDRAVMAAYGFDVKTMTESQCVAELFKLYQQLDTL